MTDAGFAQSFEFPGSVAQEYVALRSQAALVDFSFLSVLVLFGPDATSFLQGMISNDVNQVSGGEGCLATILTPIGKLIADLTVLKFSEEKFWIICRAELKEKVAQTLNRFIVTDQVEVKDVANTSALAILGPASSNCLKKTVALLPKKPCDHVETRLCEEPVLLLRDARFGIDGYQMWLSSDRRAAIRTWLEKQCGVWSASAEAFDILRIEAGVPVFGIDFDETNIPLESNLDHALDFQKGCYTGQEVIARVTYLGNISKKLTGLLVEGEKIPARGEEVSADGRVIGRVTSATVSLTLGRPIALAYIQRKYLDAGTQVELKQSGSRARVQSLPLVDVP
ncbi:MAG TPA: glycine cleavage T C-terminal barrel domain-containing protein [Acidobacteriota bacterium]|jgi:folate-binding protein YgfZ|nr:glycine cleavage T C-terminal barrel domain-containing protein [Acidobacteriota bacterium]